jgi:hypothetical protein
MQTRNKNTYYKYGKKNTSSPKKNNKSKKSPVKQKNYLYNKKTFDCTPDDIIKAYNKREEYEAISYYKPNNKLFDKIQKNSNNIVDSNNNYNNINDKNYNTTYNQTDTLLSDYTYNKNCGGTVVFNFGFKIRNIK